MKQNWLHIMLFIIVGIVIFNKSISKQRLSIYYYFILIFAVNNAPVL